jgi:AcrR family transcriptional regulator
MSPSSTDHTFKPRSARDTRRHILQVALELFSAQGFDATSLQQISDRLGVTKAALYYHFKSKDDLLRAVLEPYFTGIDALKLNEGPDAEARQANPAQRLEDYLDLLLEHREILSYLSRDAAALARPVVAAPEQAFQDLVRDGIAGANLTLEDQVKVNFALGGMRSAISANASTPADALRGPILESVESVLGSLKHQRQP